ncbi:MAG: restriction endonuclease [Nitrosopumilus sp.]|nr:restriction endonuclease [Nitrosopumilus sp.]NRA05428.1 restriction endonuclease [Nitrosopumilus sp.]
MTIPPTKLIKLPILELLADKKKHTLSETVEFIAKKFNVSEEDRKQLIPSRLQQTLKVRITWAVSELRNALLLENIENKRGIFKITQRGLEVLKENPKIIDTKFLKKFSEYRHFLGIDEEGKSTQKSKIIESDESPIEIIEESYQKIKRELIQNILTLVRKCSPDSFERLVIQLVVKMGYGGTVEDAGKAIGKQGDEGIDGIIKEDELGFEKIYVQAKRWNSSVGRPKLQEFVGALHGQKAKKGLFITSGDFTNEALRYKDKIDDKIIILIDGNELAEYMIRYNLGVFTTSVLEMKQIDSDFFEEI